MAGGAKKISESSLFDRNSFSISGVVLNDVSSTAGEIAFHADVLPAKWLKIGLHKNTHKQQRQFVSVINKIGEAEKQIHDDGGCGQLTWGW
jgi:hypothetical protein